jgi:hypothetical protein
LTSSITLTLYISMQSTSHFLPLLLKIFLWRNLSYHLHSLSNGTTVKIIQKIFRSTNQNTPKKCISETLSRLSSFASRSFLVCFSFTLRSNFAPDRFIPRIFLVWGFPQFTKNIFKIIRLNFPVSILNYRARPPRRR